MYVLAAGYNRLNLMYNSRNSTGIWNVITWKRCKSDISAVAFAKYYSSTMNEDFMELLSEKPKYIVVSTMGIIMYKSLIMILITQLAN